MRTGRPLLAVAALAIVSTGAAYTFGPGADQSTAATAAKKKTTETVETAACTADARYPKRQLRGVWIATVQVPFQAGGPDSPAALR